jgi:hypothetical protein
MGSNDNINNIQMLFNEITGTSLQNVHFSIDKLSNGYFVLFGKKNISNYSKKFGIIYNFENSIKEKYYKDLQEIVKFAIFLSPTVEKDETADVSSETIKKLDDEYINLKNKITPLEIDIIELNEKISVNNNDLKIKKLLEIRQNELILKRNEIGNKKKILDEKKLKKFIKIFKEIEKIYKIYLKLEKNGYPDFQSIFFF